MRCDFSKGQIQCAQEHNQTIDNHWTAIKRKTCMQLNDVYTFPQIHCTITKTKNSNHFMNEMYRKKKSFPQTNQQRNGCASAFNNLLFTFTMNFHPSLGQV